MPDSTSILPPKRCSKCHLEFPRTREYFDAKSNSPDGLRADCKICRRIRMREYNKRPYVQEKHRQYQRDHSLDLNERARLKRIANPLIGKQHYERYHKNDARRQYMRDYSKSYNQLPDVKAKSRKRSQIRRANPNQQIKEKAYRESPMGRASEKVRKQRRRARIVAAGGTFTAKDVLVQFESQRGLCWWCGKPVGEHFHVDHRIPLSRGGSNDSRNIVVSCEACNLSKGNKMPWEWSGRLL